MNLHRVGEGLLFAAVIAAIVFFSFYKLNESPPPWRDEGIIVQVARNLSESGRYGVQIAPGEFVSAGFVTTGYPVIYPVALSFKIFGVGLLQARLVMVGFIFLLVASAYFLMRSEGDSRIALLSLLLLAGFAPLYGHGRTVIGEVPGTALILLLMCILRHKAGTAYGPLFIVGTGMLTGFIMATKPIFLIIGIPALALMFFFARKRRLSGRQIVLFLVSLAIPVILWFLVQLDGESIREIAAIYSGDPDRISLITTVLVNIKNALTHLETIYFLSLIGAWALGLYLSRARGIISSAEQSAFIFSFLVSVAYFTTVGYYRYFFPAEVLALIYLPLSLSRLLGYLSARGLFNPTILRPLVLCGLLFLSALQFYQTSRHSFISAYFQSSRTQLLHENLSGIVEGPLLLWNLPEAVLFLPHNNYFQYIEFAEAARGKEQVPALVSGKIPRTIVIPTSLVEGAPEISDGYALKTNLGKYSIFELTSR